MIHDKFCEYEGEITSPCGQCAVLAAARADEREQAAQRVAAYADSEGVGLKSWDAAVAAARGEEK